MHTYTCIHIYAHMCTHTCRVGSLRFARCWHGAVGGFGGVFPGWDAERLLSVASLQIRAASCLQHPADRSTGAFARPARPLVGIQPGPERKLRHQGFLPVSGTQLQRAVPVLALGRPSLSRSVPSAVPSLQLPGASTHSPGCVLSRRRAGISPPSASASAAAHCVRDHDEPAGPAPALSLSLLCPAPPDPAPTCPCPCPACREGTASPQDQAGVGKQRPPM